MSIWQEPNDPNREPPAPDTDDEESPFERPPFDRDPEAQHAPGEDEQGTGSEKPPPMHAAGSADEGADNELILDAAGAEREPVGNDNIREGRVGGVMGPAHASNGQGQGD